MRDIAVNLLDSLLDAIIRLGGDALVMHVGERPYVVTSSSSLDAFRGPLSWGQVELSSRPLTPEAVLSMLGQILPNDVRQSLDDIGAIEHEIDSPDGQHRFVVVAAKGGDDVWVEVRLKQDPPAEVGELAAPAPSELPVAHQPQAVASAEAMEGGAVGAASGDWAPVGGVDPAGGLPTTVPLACDGPEVRAEAAAAAETRERELQAALGARDAELRAALETREAQVRAEAAAAAETRERELQAALEARDVELRAALETREAQVRAEAAAAAETRERELQAALETRDAELRVVVEAREADVRAQAAAAAAAREAELRAAWDAREAEVRAVIEAREREVRAEAAAAIEARQSELRAAIEARDADVRAEVAAAEAREAALRATIAAREAEILAQADASVEARAEAVRADAAAAESREAELRAALATRDAEMRATLEAREAEVRAEASAAAEAREAELVAAAAAATAAREAHVRAEAAALLEAREAELRAEALAAAAARESAVETVSRLTASQAELLAAVTAREEELRAETAAMLARRESELVADAAANLQRREQELTAQVAASLAAHKAQIDEELATRAAALDEQAAATARAAAAALAEAEQSFASRDATLKAVEARLAERESALETAESASTRRFEERMAELEAAFAARVGEADARDANREAALNAAYEERLSEAVAAATREIEARFLAAQEEQAEAAAAAARAEVEAIATLQLAVASAAAARAAMEAEAQAEILAAQASPPGGSMKAVGAPLIDAADEPVNEPRPIALLLPRHGPAVHSSTAILLEVLHDGLERGASAVYAIGGARPLMRIEGEITSSGSLPILHSADIDRFAFEFAPRDEVAHSTSEWTTTVPGVGRLRCVSFEDAAGRGLVFHLAANISTADELGLSREIQALCNEPDGLVVLAGPRASGKSTLLSAFVDRINRGRSDHVITIESRVRMLHEQRHSLISQREVDGEGTAIARAARAALREGPDVLVIDDARSPEAIAVAIDAARAGRLVFASMPAPTTTAAIERLTDAFSVDRRPQVRALLSGALRAVISQVLVTKRDGGRIGAREVLLSSPPVAQLILDGAYGQVPIAIEGGRRLGMCTLTDSLVALVRDGVVEAAEAVRSAPNRRVIVAALQQEGIDVSQFERRA